MQFCSEGHAFTPCAKRTIEITLPSFRPCPHVSGYFWIRNFSFRIQTFPRPSVSVFKSNFPVHTYPTVSTELNNVCDGSGLGSKLVSFAKGFSKHPHIFPIFTVDSEYLRFPFKVKVDYFILYSILVSTFVIFLLLFSMNKRRRRKEASLL